MNFEKAHKELLNGKKIRRKEWEPLMHLHLIEKNIIAYRGEIMRFYDEPNILLSNNWLVVDGDGTKMNFLEALEMLKQKKAMTREEMHGAFLFIDDNQMAICHPVEYVFMPTFKCMCANDWEIMK